MVTDGAGEIFHNHTICTCQFVITTAINGSGMQGLHAGKSVTVHNCSRWVALYIMNVKET